MKPRVEEVQNREKDFEKLQEDLKNKSVRRDVTPKKEIQQQPSPIKKQEIF